MLVVISQTLRFVDWFIQLLVIIKPAYKILSLTHRKCRSKPNIWILPSLLLKNKYGRSQLYRDQIFSHTICIYNRKFDWFLIVDPIWLVWHTNISHWSTDPLIHWSTDPLIHWSTDPLIHWSTDPLIHWSTDPLIHWSTDPLIHWSTDPLIHWTTEPLIHPPITYPTRRLRGIFFTKNNSKMY